MFRPYSLTLNDGEHSAVYELGYETPVDGRTMREIIIHRLTRFFYMQPGQRTVRNTVSYWRTNKRIQSVNGVNNAEQLARLFGGYGWAIFTDRAGKEKYYIFNG